MSLSNFAPTFPRSLHIALVTETWLPDINGVASSLFYLMQQLKQMGHRITVIAPEPAQAVAVDTTLGVAIDEKITVKGMPIPHYSHLRMGLPNKQLLLQKFTALKPDIVHIATEGLLGLTALKVAKKLKIKVSSGYHTSFDDFSRHFGWTLLSSTIMRYLKYFHNRCEATCVPSDKTLQQLQQQGIKNLYLVGRGINKQLFNPQKRNLNLRQAWGAGEETTVLMYVGRVSPEKGIETVIEGFQALQLRQLYRHFKLVIVGDGPAKASLMEKYQKRDLPEHQQDIIFTGFQTGENLAEHYASGDAFIFASQVETFGNVVVEAMASGLPVFAYKDAVAGILVDTSCGETVPIEQKIGQKNTFIEMVANLPKLQQLHAMRAVAEQKVENFSWQTPAQAMLAMFYQVLGVDMVIEKIEPVKNANLPKAKPIFLPVIPNFPTTANPKLVR